MRHDVRWSTAVGLLAVILAVTASVCARAGEPVPAGGTDVAIHIALPQGSMHEWGRLSAVSGSTAEPEVVDRQIDLPWEGWLSLDPGANWTLSVVAPGFWAPSTTLLAGARWEAQEFALLRTGRIVGRARFPDEVARPGGLSVRLESTPVAGVSSERRTAVVGEPTTVNCALDDERWECELPATSLDLRIASDGFAPIYRWDVAVDAGGAKDLGTLSFVRGASLAGWVVVGPGAAAAVQPTTVTVEPMIGAWQERTEERQRLRALERRTGADRRGFFQLKGLAAGDYELVVERPGFSPRRVRSLRIAEGQELLLDEPIELDRLATLDVFVEPSTDPYGRPWQVSLLAQVGPPSFNRRILRSATGGGVSVNGHWRGEQLPLDDYVLRLEDNLGSRWLERPLTLGDAEEVVELDVPIVPVEGRLERGNEPLAATLVFGGSTVPQISMFADDRGRFEGYLPREGIWTIDLKLPDAPLLEQAVEPVEVERRPGHRSAYVEISLPDTTLEGSVVDESGPVAAADVDILREGERLSRAAILRSEEVGIFALRGLPAGRFQLRARHHGRSSGWHGIDLVEGRRASVVLNLREKTKVSGDVRNGEVGVAGALVVAIPVLRDASLAFYERAVTGADGSFSLAVSPQASEADVLVLAPGFALAMRRIATAEPSYQLFHLEIGGGEISLNSDSPSPQTCLLHGNASVHLQSLVSLSLPTRAELGDGVLRLLDMPVGSYAVCPCAAPSAPLCASGVLGPGGVLSLEVPSRRGAGEEGRS